jgi:hypothetical protein
MNENLNELFNFPCHIAIAGRSKCGKSTILINILRAVQDNFDKVFIFCDSNQYTKEYDEFDFVEKFDLNKLIKIMEKAKEYQEDGEPRRILIVMDDISARFYNDIESVDTLAGYLTECRHYNVSVILSVHYLKSILNPLIRENIHYYIVNKNQTPHSIKVLSEIVFYNNEDHDNRKLLKFIKDETAINQYCFMIIDVERDRYIPFYIEKKIN